MPRVYPKTAPMPRAPLFWDGSDYRVPVCDAQGNVRLAPGGVNLQQFQEIWMYSGNIMGSSGILSLQTPAIGAAELIMMCVGCCYLSAGSATALRIHVQHETGLFTVANLTSPTVNSRLFTPVALPLGPGDSVTFQAISVGSGTTFNANTWGYYVQL